MAGQREGGAILLLLKVNLTTVPSQDPAQNKQSNSNLFHYSTIPAHNRHTQTLQAGSAIV